MTISWPNLAEQEAPQHYAGKETTRQQTLDHAMQSRAEEQLSALLGEIGDAFYAVDGNWRITAANRAAGRRSGHPWEAILCRPIWDVLPWLKAEAFRLRLDHAMRTGERTEFDAHLPEAAGGRVEIRLFPYADGLGILLRDKPGQDDVHENEARLRLATEAAGLGIWDWDLATGEIVCSGLTKTIHGLPADAPVNRRTLRDAIHPDDLPRISSQFQRALDGHTRERKPYEYRIIRQDGTIGWVLVQGKVMFDRVGGEQRALRYVGTVHDISARKRAEEALKESEARLMALADNMPLGMVFQITMTRERKGRRFVYVSQNCLRVNGVTPEKALEDPAVLDSLILPEHWPTLAAAEAEALHSLKPMDVEVRMRHAMTGEIRWFQIISAPRVLSNGWLVWDGIQNDITDRKRSAEALRQSEEHLRTILDELPVGVTLTQVPDGTLLFQNAKSVELLGHLGRTAEDDAGPIRHGPIHPDGAPYEIHECPVASAIMSGRSVDQLEVLYRRRDGRIVDLAMDSALVQNSDGSSFAVSAFYDVTERKRAEEHQRLLINELNHRVKNTLATVQSLAVQSFKSTALSDDGRAARSAFEARLFALARGHDVLTRENWEGAGLNEIVSQAFAPYRDQCGSDDILETEGPDLRISPAMALSLSMAFHELCTNALKYGALSVAGGRVRISWETAAADIGSRLLLRWEERGGPPVTPPVRRGFGSRLIEGGLARELNGTVHLSYEPAGVTCTMDAPLS